MIGREVLPIALFPKRLLRIHYESHTEMIACCADLTFAACTHHVATTVLIRAEEKIRRVARVSSHPVLPDQTVHFGPVGLREMPPALASCA